MSCALSCELVRGLRAQTPKKTATFSMGKNSGVWAPHRVSWRGQPTSPYDNLPPEVAGPYDQGLGKPIGLPY